MSRMKANLIALLLVFTGISMCANDNVAYAADTPYMDADGGFISEQMTVTKGIIPTATTEGYEDWLFAGWYTDNVCTKANVIKKAKIDEHNGKSAYAKFVPSEVLTVKVQVSEGTKDSGSTNMRFVSSIDTLNYAGVGIRVEYHGASGVVTKTFAGTKVFSKIIASAESGVDYNYNPKVFDTESAWFITGTVTNIPSEKYADNFVVKPYWVTFDGTYVYGESRYVQVQDAYNDVVNVPVKADSQTTMDGLAIAGESVNERRYYTGEKYGALMISKSRSTLPSLTSYEVKSGNNLIQTATYRNLESALGELTNHIPSGDTSWYDVINQEKEFVIVTAADLYGLAELVNDNTQTFEGKTIYLGANITVNEDASSYSWNPIGSSNAFKGIFEGYKCVISGVQAESDANYLGLFGIMGTNSKVQNLRLINSTFVQTGTGVTGSIVGECNGMLDNVYSDADVTTSYRYAGGLVGRANASGLKNCWYDGSISLKGDALYGGGMVSVLANESCAMENCLFTGSIHSEHKNKKVYAFVGGMCGGVETQATSLTMESCVSTGDIMTSNADFGAGIFVGRSKGSAEQKISMSNVFGAKDAGYTEIGAKGTTTVSGQVVWTTNSDRFIGYCSEDTSTDYKGAKLNFDTTWVVRESGVPIPATFTDVSSKVAIASGSTLDETLTRSIGIDLVDGNCSLATALHYGAGKYVLRFDSINESIYTHYVSQLKESVENGGLGFIEYQKNEMDSLLHGIYTRKVGDWVLEVLYSKNSKEMSITVRTGVEELLSPNLMKEHVIAEGNGNVTLSMLTLTGTEARVEEGLKDPDGNALTVGDLLYYFGNSFVFQLPNGHFIVNDGGNLGDFEGLMEYLKVLSGKNISGEQNPVRIDAWTISHHHGDHFGVIKGFYGNSDAMEGVTVEAFYVNEPNNRTLDYLSKNDNGVYTKDSDEAKLHYRGIRSVRTVNGERTPIYSYQTGEKYYFNGLTMDVIQSQEQIPVGEYAMASSYAVSGTDFNTTSTVLLFTTDDGQTTMIGGDANYANQNWIMDAYGDTPSALIGKDGIDVFQVWHHGKNMSNTLEYEGGTTILGVTIGEKIASDTEINVFTNYLTNNAQTDFEVAFFPCSLIYGEEKVTDWYSFPYAWKANQYLINSCLGDSKTYYTYETDTTKVVRVEFDGQGGLTHGRYDILTTEDKEESGTITPGSPDQNIPGLWD